MTTSRFLACAVGAALVIAGCGDNLDAPGPDSLIVDLATASLHVGEAVQVTATYRKADADVAGDRVTWSSSDPGHVAVQGTGASVRITAVGAGTATVTASGSGLEATIQVSVAPATLAGIAITPPAPSLAAGTTRALNVVATYSDHTTADITPSVAWASAQPAIAAVTGSVLTGVVKGETTITAMYQGQFSSTHVFVTDAVLRTIDVAPPTASVVLGQVQQFTATGHFSDASTRDVTATATWTSSAPAIATISNVAGTKGLAATLAVGPVTISAAVGTVTGTATLTVEPSALVSIEITPGADLALTADQPFTATGTFSDHSTQDLTASVTWASSDPAIATIGADGVATALAVGTTTITAQRDTISGAAVVNVVVPDVGPWVAAAGFAGRPCHDGVKLSMLSDAVYVCTAANGLVRGTIAADTSISFAAPSSGVAGMAGLSLAAHTQSPSTMMYATVPSGAASNWFRSSDSGATLAPFALLDSAGNARFLYAGRFQPMIGNILGSWDPGTAGTPQAIVLTGSNPPTGVHPVATATGTVRAITGSAVNNLYVAVLGETPTGAAATGGVFRSTSSAATWTAADTGIAAADKDRVASLVIDPTNPLILYAGVRGGGRIYKTTDGGASWAPSALGIPGRAQVSVVYVSPVNPASVFAATERGLYRSADAGATWALAGFQGRAVNAIAQSGVAPALILAGVDDAIGLYRAP
jgi:uncharacterized protein YjdB